MVPLRTLKEIFLSNDYERKKIWWHNAFGTPLRKSGAFHQSDQTAEALAFEDAHSIILPAGFREMLCSYYFSCGLIQFLQFDFEFQSTLVKLYYRNYNLLYFAKDHANNSYFIDLKTEHVYALGAKQLFKELMYVSRDFTSLIQILDAFFLDHFYSMSTAEYTEICDYLQAKSDSLYWNTIRSTGEVPFSPYVY